MAEVHPEAEFFAFLETGRFMIQRNRESGRCFFYPRVAEPGTGSTDLEWVEACGRGTVYATTIIRQKPPTPSYNFALIDLEEGPRLTSRVDGIDPEAVRIGMSVRASIMRENDKAILVFVPV
ncbi:MAG: OB-fold domain-containing protein [Steroidobacteraceae bacterium]